MNHSKLSNHEDKLCTSMGKAFLGDRVIMRGRDLHRDLGRMDWFSLYLFSITGREFSPDQLKLLNFFWVSTSYPDPSIWPNHVVALAASVRSTPALSIMAGQVLTEATIYGGRPFRKGLEFYVRAGQALDSGLSLDTFIEKELKERKTIYGYGRPLASKDERVDYLLEYAQELGLAGGRYLKIALDVYRYLHDSRGLSMNIAAVYSSLAADLGFAAEEYQLFMSLCFIVGMYPCYLGAKQQEEGTFFPMRCSSLKYDGPQVRDWD